MNELEVLLEKAEKNKEKLSQQGRLLTEALRLYLRHRSHQGDNQWHGDNNE